MMQVSVLYMLRYILTKKPISWEKVAKATIGVLRFILMSKRIYLGLTVSRFETYFEPNPLMIV